jgi:hypothetical protein
VPDWTDRFADDVLAGIAELLAGTVGQLAKMSGDVGVVLEQ